MLNWSVCLIARNESKTLPRMIDSLKEFQARGGEIIVVDTGSVDSTAEIARGLGCSVYEVGDRFRSTITADAADAINGQFVEGGEEPLVLEGDTYFDFASARNYAASLARNDMVSMPDCDEVFTAYNLDAIKEAIEQGAEQFEYNFVFSHDAEGRELIKFMHSKFYNRTKLKWVGIIHEVLQGDAKRQFCPENIIKLEHWQNVETNRSGYLKGLAIDVFNNPDNDRNSHYFARELYYYGRYKSAIKEFERHIAMNKWPAERGQSWVYMGDCYEGLGEVEKALECWHKAYTVEANRREPLLRLANYYYRKNDYQRVAVYVAASLQIENSFFYSNDQYDYTNKPHELMYWALFYMGRKEESKEHWLKALEYQPTNSKYLHDAKFYIVLPKVSIVIPSLGREEGLKRCKDSIEKLNYPQELIETLVYEGEDTVPEKVAKGVAESTGEYIVYAANDTEFTPDCLIQAVLAAKKHNKRLIALNTGEVSPDGGNICEHFMIARNLIPQLDGGIFCVEFRHVGVDNYLWAQCKKLDDAMRCDEAVMNHYHFSTGKSEFDEVYKKVWEGESVAKDRELLAKKLAELNV